MKFFEKIRNEEELKNAEDLIRFLDCCFDEVRVFVEISCSKLNNSRMLFRILQKIDALEEFNYFKDLCLDFLESLDLLENIVKEINRSKKVEKIISTTKEIVEKTTKRTIKSKIPMPEIDYLKAKNITEFDIDWMIKKMKIFWSKFLQVYGSLRIDIILLHKSM